MSSTNKTTKLGLSQFLGTDKPAWLGDYNSDMQKIDDAFTQLEQSGESSAADIEALQQKDAELAQSITDVNDRVDTVSTDLITVGNRTTVLEGNYDTIHHELVLNGENVEKCFRKTGGTIDGNLHVNNNQIVMFSPNIVKGETPTESKYMEFRFQDNSNLNTVDNNLSRMTYAQRVDGTTSLNMMLSKNETGAAETVRLEVGFDINGNPYTFSPTPTDPNANNSEIATTRWIVNKYGSFKSYKGTIAAGKTLNIGLRPYAGMYELMTGHEGNTNLIGDYKVFGTNANTLSVIAKVKEAAELTVTATNGGLTVKNNGTSTCEYVFIRYYCADNTDVTFA